jgi:hypothetical protein
MVFDNWTLPPRFVLATSREPIRPSLILGRMPLSGKFGMRSGNTIGLDHFFASTTRTSSKPAACDGCLPFMVLGNWTFPPRSVVATSRELSRCAVTILGRMPLSSEFGMRSRKTIGPDHCFTRTTRTASNPAAFDGCLPLMVLGNWTFPPRSVVATSRELIRRAVTIPGWMPLSGNLGMHLNNGSTISHSPTTNPVVTIDVGALQTHFPFVNPIATICAHG